MRVRLRLSSIRALATWLYCKTCYVGERSGWGPKAVPNEIRADGNVGFGDLWARDVTRIATMDDLVRRLAAKLVVMVSPHAPLGKWNEVVMEGLRGLARGNGLVASTGLEDVLSRLPAERLGIPGDGHRSAAAHRAAGEYLAQAVRNLL